MKSDTKNISHSQSYILMILNDYIIHTLNEGFWIRNIFNGIIRF